MISDALWTLLTLGGFAGIIYALDRYGRRYERAMNAVDRHDRVIDLRRELDDIERRIAELKRYQSSP